MRLRPASVSRGRSGAEQLAEHFVQNVMSELPAISILITDYWDFYAPTIYLQNVRKMRQDVTIVDTSLLRYPWYLSYLEKYSPALIQASRDVVEVFSVEQRRWVNGDVFDPSKLQKSYEDLINSFVTRHEGTRPASVLFLNETQVVPDYRRRNMGLTTRLLPENVNTAPPPPEPQYNLDGLIERDAPLDTSSCLNSRFYTAAYRTLGAQYERAGNREAALRAGGRLSVLESKLSELGCSGQTK